MKTLLFKLSSAKEFLFQQLNKRSKSTLTNKSGNLSENVQIEENSLKNNLPERVTTYLIPKPNFSLRNVNLFPILNRNMLAFLKSFPSKELIPDGKKLSQHLKKRHEKLTQVVPSSRNYIRKYLYREELNEFEKKPESYKMIYYGERESVSYLSSLSPQVFAATVRVLNELKLRFPDFRPSNILDFGSGTGMTIWASHKVWNNTNFSIDCIEPSKPMVELAKTLMRDKENPQTESIFSGVDFSPFFYKDKVYDVVVASFTLTEFPHYHTRKTIVSELWQRTKDYLVIIDHGNWNGFKSILAARQLATTKSLRDDPASIISPVLPTYKKMSRTKYSENTADLPCSFIQYANVSFTELHRKRWNYSKTSFSFIILRKGHHGAEFPFHRILDYPMRRGQTIICHFCTPEGNIEKHVFSKKKHKEAYDALRFDVNGGDELKLPRDYIRSLVPFNNYGPLRTKLSQDILAHPLPPSDTNDMKTDDYELEKDDKRMLKNNNNHFITLDQIVDPPECPNDYDDENFNN